MASNYFPDFPIARKLKGDSAGPHEAALWHLYGTYNGAKDVREQFTQRKAEIEARGKAGELGPRGVEMELKKLAAEFEPRLRQLGALVDKVKAHHNETRAKLTARTKVEKSADADEAVRRAFQEHRVIARFESLDPAERREAIRLAVDKRDVNFLAAIVAEPALLNDADVRRIETVLMSTADKGLFHEYEELGGTLDAKGEVMFPHESPLAVASFALDSTREWIAEQAGGLDARGILDQAGVDLTVPVLSLTTDQGHDPQVYRAARELAMADGKVLSIGGDNGAAATIPVTPDSGGQES